MTIHNWKKLCFSILSRRFYMLFQELLLVRRLIILKDSNMALLIRFKMIPLVLMFLLACNGGTETEGDNDLGNRPAEIAEDEWQEEVNQAIVRNKENLSELFDSIAEKSFTRLLYDESRLKGPEFLKFEGKSLREIEGLLK